MEEEKGLSDWEWSIIKHAKPSFLRKRFREEFDHLYSVGTLVDAIKNDFLLSHILAYAWKSTYYLALVCKRFWIITKSRVYWSALTKHALKGMIPAPILNHVNFFYFHKETDPSHLFLQGLFKKRQTIKFDRASVEFNNHDGTFDLTWYEGKLEYSIYWGETNNGENILMGARQTRVYFNDPNGLQKLVWNDMMKRTGSRISIYHYCEVYDSKTGLTWYGQPGVTESDASFVPNAIDLKPRSHSFGVWK